MKSVRSIFEDLGEAGFSGAPSPEGDAGGKLEGVTGVILAGGASSRMGSDKALLPHNGARFIEGIYLRLAELFHEVIVVTNKAEQYGFLPCKKVPDLFPGKGVAAGIHAGLWHSSEQAIFTVACDMPNLNAEVIRHLISLSPGFDVVIPATAEGREPLHALYRKECLPFLEALLEEPEPARVVRILPQVRVREVVAEEIAPLDPGLMSFANINTPDDYFRLKDGKKMG